jgi:Protein of unknown function (DUF2949)
MSPAKQNSLIHFLSKDLALPAASIALALKKCAAMPNFLPMTLWQYGLISLEQLGQIFDWLGVA